MLAAAAVLFAAALFTRGRIALALLSGGLFSSLAVLALRINTSSLLSIDTAAATFFDARRNPKRGMIAGGIFDYIGEPLHVLVPAVVCGMIFSLLALSAMPAISIIGVIGAGVVIEETLKAVIERTAATPQLADYPHSFPSGHVTGTAALLGMIAVCLGVGRSCAVKVRLAAVVVTAVVFVAYLALFTGAHTFTDVIGGMLLGGAIVSAGAAVLGDCDLSRWRRVLKRRRTAQARPVVARG